MAYDIRNWNATQTAGVIFAGPLRPRSSRPPPHDDPGWRRTPHHPIAVPASPR